MQCEYFVGEAEHRGMGAYAYVNISQQTSNIYLRSPKCIKCKSFFDNKVGQLISAINHEVQEILVVSILFNERNEYKCRWFDETTSRYNKKEYGCERGCCTYTTAAF